MATNELAHGNQWTSPWNWSKRTNAVVTTWINKCYRSVTEVQLILECYQVISHVLVWFIVASLLINWAESFVWGVIKQILTVFTRGTVKLVSLSDPWSVLSSLGFASGNRTLQGSPWEASFTVPLHSSQYLNTMIKSARHGYDFRHIRRDPNKVFETGIQTGICEPGCTCTCTANGTIGNNREQ